ncbi:hypothetical protein PIB30_074680 [Stylosanthes scabra]|uniref:Uncharacterized protein n=1 Tax=Stylosanthes scabra TaxID=79078 RepID=A0ABU6ZNG2_9FABA|nr:hypothetical protein [Stylosanthes scabra]
MSAKTPWKDNTENLREVPRICVAKLPPSLGMEHHALAWPSFLQHPESKFRHGSKPSSSQALQSPRICVEVDAYAWKLTSSAQNLISPTHMREILRICLESYAYAWEAD